MPQPEPSDIRIELRFEKFSAFVERYAQWLSLGGMFIETDDDRPVGSLVDFDVKLTDGFRLIQGLGEVIWARRKAAGPDLPAGLGVRFQGLNDEGRELILKILEERVRSGLEPFDVEEVPADVRAAEAAAPAAGEPAPAAESPDAAGTGSRPMPDLEKKLLGEDGFTLIDTERAKSEAKAEKSFEELSFDAPWGKTLPDLPEEVLEEDSEAAGESPDPSPPDAPEAPAPSSPDAPATSAPSPPAPPPAEASNPPEPSPPDPPDASAALDAAIAESELSGVDSRSEEEARQAALDDSMALAAEAAAELDASPPSEDALDEPDFDDIDFGAMPEEDDDLDAAGAEVDFAFDPDPEDQLPPLELAELDDDDPFTSALLDDDSTAAGGAEALDDGPAVVDGAEVPEDDPTMITSEPAVALDDDLTEVGSRPPAAVGEIEAPAGELDLPGEASFAELSGDPVPAGPSESFDFGDSDPFEPARGGQQLENAEATIPEIPAPEPLPDPSVPPPSPSSFSPAPPAVPEPAGVPEDAAASEAGTVSVGGAPLPVQDYEDDLFADASGAGSAKRPAIPVRWLIAAGLLLVLGGAGYAFRGPIAELVGLGKPASAGPRSAEPQATGAQAASETPPAGVAPAAGAEAVPAADFASPPGAEAAASGDDPSIPVIEVSETSPPAGDAVDDPTAEPGDPAPPIESIAPLSPSAASPASRVERISWSPDRDGTRVTVSLNGRLDDGRHAHLSLDYEPAREMIKLIDIDEPYVSSYLDVGTPQVARIRVGYHPRPDGADLHVVFDYPHAGPRVESVRNLGDRLEVLIVGP